MYTLYTLFVVGSFKMPQQAIHRNGGSVLDNPRSSIAQKTCLPPVVASIKPSKTPPPSVDITGATPNSCPPYETR